MEYFKLLEQSDIWQILITLTNLHKLMFIPSKARFFIHTSNFLKIKNVELFVLINRVCQEDI